MIAYLAVLSACVALGGCFFHHHQTIQQPIALPPLK
jgi:hypothetical protein